jgi:hypothetical protein
VSTSAQDRNSIKAFEYLQKNKIENMNDALVKVKDRNNFYYRYVNGHLSGQFENNSNNFKTTANDLIISYFLYYNIEEDEKKSLCKKFNVCENRFIIRELSEITNKYINNALINLDSSLLINLKHSLDSIEKNAKVKFQVGLPIGGFDEIEIELKNLYSNIDNTLFEVEFRILKNKNKGENFDEFINKYSTVISTKTHLNVNLKNNLLDSAKYIVHKLDYNEAIKNNTKNAYSYFIDKHPNSNNNSVFKWKVIRDTASLGVYENYIKNYSNSIYKDSALLAIDSIRFSSLESTSSLTMFNFLIESDTKWSKITKEKYCYLLNYSNDTIELKNYIAKFNSYPCCSQIVDKYKKVKTIDSLMVIAKLEKNRKLKSLDSLVTLANLYFYNLDYNEIDESSKRNFSIYTEKEKLVDYYQRETGYIEKLNSIHSGKEDCYDTYNLPTLGVYIGYNPFNRAVRFKTLKEYIFEVKYVVDDGIEYYERTPIANCKFYNNKINSPLHDLTFLRIKDEVFATRRAYPIHSKDSEPWDKGEVSLVDYNCNNRKIISEDYNIELYKISGEITDDINGRRLNNYKLTKIGVIDSSQLKCNDCFLTNINDTLVLCRYDNARLISKSLCVDIKKIKNNVINLAKTSISSFNNIDITEENNIEKLYKGKYFTIKENNNISCWVLNRAREIEFLPIDKIHSDLKLKAIIEIDGHLIAVEQTFASDSNKIAKLFKGDNSLEYYASYSYKRKFAFTDRENPFYKYIAKLYIIPINEEFKRNVIIKRDYEYVNENNIHNLAINYYYFNYELKKQNKFLTLRKYLEINVKEDLGLKEFELKSEVEECWIEMFAYIGSEKFINRIKNEKLKFYTICKMDEINTDSYRFNLLFANHDDKDFSKILNNILDYRRFSFKKDQYGRWDNQYYNWNNKVLETITDNKFIELIKYCDILNKSNAQYSGYYSWVNSGSLEESDNVYFRHFGSKYENGKLISKDFSCREINYCKTIVENSLRLNDNRFYILELISSSNYFWFESKYGNINESVLYYKNIPLLPVLFLPYPNWENKPPSEKFDETEAMKRIISNSTDFKNGFVEDFRYYGYNDNIRISDFSKNKIISPIKVEPNALKVIPK